MRHFAAIHTTSFTQFLEDIDCDEGGVTVEWKKEGIDVYCPWMDGTARFKLTRCRSN